MKKTLASCFMAFGLLTATAQTDTISTDTLTTDTMVAINPDSAAVVAGPITVQERAGNTTSPWLWALLPTLALLGVVLAYCRKSAQLKSVRQELEEQEQRLGLVKQECTREKNELELRCQELTEKNLRQAELMDQLEKKNQYLTNDCLKLGDDNDRQQERIEQLEKDNQNYRKEIRRIPDLTIMQEQRISELISDISKLNEENELLKKQLSPLPSNSASPTFTYHFNAIITGMEQLAAGVRQAAQPSTIIEAIVSQMQADIASTQKLTNSTLNTHLQKALRPSGWINSLAQLYSYSRLPQLNSQLRAYGIDSTLLERLLSHTNALLGAADMSLTIPAVLASDFSEEAYRYQNGDVWIDKLFNGVNSRDYEGKVLDIVQVGYTIGTQEEKPVVKF